MDSFLAGDFMDESDEENLEEGDESEVSFACSISLETKLNNAF